VIAASLNSLLLYLGIVFADNWREAAQYLATYSKVATVVVAAAVVIFLWWFFRKRRGAANTATIMED
jgi:membrane protein DedA with SNARE-associated domain